MARTWSDAVRLLRELDGRETAAQFEIGDIALEQAPIGADHARNGSLEIIQRLADESGISFNTLMERRKVAARFPDDVRTSSVSYSVFVLIATREDAEERQRLLEMIATTPPTSKSGRWTVDLLRQYLGIRPTRFPPPEEATPESKRAAFADLANDPEIIQEAARMTTPTAQAVGNLLAGAHKIREQQREQQIESDPVSKRIDQNIAALDVEAACRQFAADTEKFVESIVSLTPRLGQAGEDDRYWITLSVERARASLDRLEVFTTTGKSDLDGFLEETLSKR
jgi:hypothetical protein